MQIPQIKKTAEAHAGNANFTANVKTQKRCVFHTWGWEINQTLKSCGSYRHKPGGLVSRIKINFRKHKVVGHESWVGIKMWNEKQSARPPFTTSALDIKKLSQWKTAKNFHPRVYQEHFLFIRQHATHNSTNAYYIIRAKHRGKRARLGAASTKKFAKCRHREKIFARFAFNRVVKNMVWVVGDERSWFESEKRGKH